MKNEKFSISEKEYRIIVTPQEEVGYYIMEGKNKKRLTNFIVVLEGQNFGGSDYRLYGKVYSSFGRNTEIYFKDISVIDTSNKLRTLLRDTLGIGIEQFIVDWKELGQIIKEYCLKHVDLNPPPPKWPKIEFASFFKDELIVGEYGITYAIGSPVDKIGYWVVTDRIEVLTNFIFDFQKVIRYSSENGKGQSFLSGKILFNDGAEFPFIKEPIKTFYYKNSLTNFVLNHRGLAVCNFSSEFPKHLLTMHAKDIKEIGAIEHGYDSKNKSYNTQSVSITKEIISQNENDLEFTETWGDNKLDFRLDPDFDIKLFSDEIENLLFKWDTNNVMFPSLAFTFLPIIYPFIRHQLPNKFYMMLVGTSGSGKSLIAKWMQNFYGTFNTLVSWTSTGTAISFIGNSFKDSLFVVDDFKKENFATYSEIKNVMQVLQNYSDVTTRQRAGGGLKVNKEKPIKGFLMISAEDTVFNQTSTFARGIILDVQSKELKRDLVDTINKLSIKFKTFTPYYIQHILSKYDNEQLTQLLISNQEFFHKYAIEKVLPNDNLARVVNNFATLKTSWDCIIKFLITDKEKFKVYNSNFDETIKEVFISNFNLVDENKAIVKFSKGLWEYAETHRAILEIKEWDGIARGSIGCFEIRRNSTGAFVIKICVSMTVAFNAVNTHLSNSGGIGLSESSLTKQLEKRGLIRTNDSGMVSFSGGKKVRGVEWIGDYSERVLGIKSLPTNDNG